MTRFEKDVIEIEEGNEIEVLKRRKAELEDLYQKGRCEKNAFRRQCIVQEYTRKLAEYVLSGKLNDAPSGRLFRADFRTLQMCQSL